jgi:hypothetical protein
MKVNIRYVFMFSSLFFVALLGCTQETIQTHIVEKTVIKTMETPQSRRQGISWSYVPSHWTLTTASGLRIASFMAKQHSHTTEITVISLPERSQTLLANINRWRGQLSLPSVTAKDIGSMSQKLTLLGLDMTAVHLVADTQAIYSVIFPYNGNNVFVKIQGSIHEVEEEIYFINRFIGGLVLD